MAAALAIWLNKTGRINGTLAIETWAEEADCGDITLGGTGGNFARVWIISSATALGLISLILVPFVWCNKSSKKMIGTEDDSSMKPRSTVKDDIRRTEPDLASARRHLVSSSATVGGKWLNPFCTDIDTFSAIGGSGLEMYFTTLRTLGILFATMAALTFPTSAFCLLGTFAPDNGQFLARASIGNLGLLADSKVLDPLMRIVRAGCDGAELSDLTPIFAWLDLASMIILFVYLVRFRFIEIPRRALTDDLENVSVQDFSVVIDKLPPRIDHQPDYKRLLKNHLEERMRVVQAGKPGPEPHVADITLVRDYGGRLESLKARGHMLQSIDVAKAYGKEKRIFKAEGRLAKLDKRLEAQLEPDSELPVLRAYVILNRTADKHGLMYDYRLANFALFRCCQSSSKRFFGAALRVREAPQPSDLLWENQDTPWWSRLLRQLCMFVTFIIILAISLALIYVTTVYGKREAGVQLSYIGNELCDPETNYSGAPEDDYICIVSTAANWTKDFAATEGGNILNCWCESQGYAKLVEDTSLVSTCTPWFLKTARGIGIMTAASCVVVLINLVLQYVLIAMAYFERPLSLTALNKSMMTKIFLAQTLNTGFVLFIVNTYGPDGMKKQWQEAVALLTESWHHSDADSVTVNCTISACAAAYRWKEATVLLSEMAQHTAMPDVISYTAVINACEKARLWQQALVALSSATAQLDPDACLHNATIAAMQRSAQWQRALWLLQEICNSEAGVQPDAISFNSAISACSSAAHWERSLALLMAMQRWSLRPDAVGTSAALRGIGQARRWPGALGEDAADEYNHWRPAFSNQAQARVKEGWEDINFRLTD
eukprot:s1197_g8.t7